MNGLPLFPVSTVGSWPRSHRLLLAQRTAGNNQAANHTAAGLPEGSACALAWKRQSR